MDMQIRIHTTTHTVSRTVATTHTHPSQIPAPWLFPHFTGPSGPPRNQPKTPCGPRRGAQQDRGPAACWWVGRTGCLFYTSVIFLRLLLQYLDVLRHRQCTASCCFCPCFFCFSANELPCGTLINSTHPDTGTFFLYLFLGFQA